MKQNNNSEGPTVCLCIPAYNASGTIAETLESLLTQTYKNISIYVVDNASTDNTCGIVRSYSNLNPCIKLLSFSENIGGEGNFNRCIQLAEGDYTGIFHADDVYEPTMVEKQVAFLERHNEVAAVLTRARLIDAEGIDKGLTALPPEIADDDGVGRTYGFEEIFRYVIRNHNFFVCPSALVRTQVYKQHVRVWDGAKFRSSADLGVWFKILEKYRIGILPEPLINYRQSPSQGTAVLQYLDTARADFFLVIDHYLQTLPPGVTISKYDRRNLRFLYFRDNCRRAANCLITDKYDEARDLTRDMLSLSMLLPAFLTKPHLLVNHSRLFFWVYGIMLYILARIPRNSLISKVIAKLKYGKNL